MHEVKPLMDTIIGWDICNLDVWVKHQRKHCNKNQGVRAAAREIGISPTTLSKIENGHLPDSETLKKVLKWLGCRLAFYESAINSN